MNKFPTHKQILALLLFPLLLQACASMSYVRRTDQVIPAKYHLGDMYKTATVIDRSRQKGLFKSISRVLNNQEINGIKSNQSGTELVRHVASNLPRSIETNWNSIKLKDGIENGPAPRLSSSLIAGYTLGTDILISLERLQATEYRTYTNITKNQLDPQGKSYTIEAVKGYKESHLINYWRIYDAKTAEVIYEIDDTIKQGIEVEALTRNDARIKLDTNKAVDISSLTRVCEQKLTADLNPRYIQSAWMYYKKGNEDLKLSGNFIKSGDYTASIRLLENALPQYTKTKEKARAYYNIAACYNLNGDLDKAIEWAQKGYELTDDRMLRNLIGQMQEANYTQNN